MYKIKYDKYKSKYYSLKYQIGGNTIKILIIGDHTKFNNNYGDIKDIIDIINKFNNHNKLKLKYNPDAQILQEYIRSDSSIEISEINKISEIKDI